MLQRALLGTRERECRRHIVHGVGEMLMPSRPAILVVRLGAMGDILHALPAVAALKLGHPEASLAWVVEPKWAPLLEQNPFVDRVLLLQRHSLSGLLATRRALRETTCQLAVDFQGLLKSALV